MTPYGKQDNLDRYARYKIFTHALAWTIWKTYTQYQFGDRQTFRTDEMAALYRKILTDCARRDHAARGSNRYTEKSLKTNFRIVWGVETKNFGLRKQLPTLSQDDVAV